MAVSIKSAREIELMRDAGKMLADVHVFLVVQPIILYTFHLKQREFVINVVKDLF